MAQEPSSVHSHFQKKLLETVIKNYTILGYKAFGFCPVFLGFFVPTILHWLGFWF